MKRTGSVTTSENSPKMRGMTCSPVSGSIMSPMGPPNGMLRTGEVFTKKISLMKTSPPVNLFDDVVEERDVLRRQRVAPGGSTPTTLPSLKNTAHSSLSTVSCDQNGKF